MFGIDEIERRLVDRKISVSYAFDPQEPSTQLDPSDGEVDPKKPEQPGTRIFRQHYFGDRLALTLGPLAYSHSAGRKIGRRLFKGRRHCFDLRATGGKLTIEPRETLTVETIENVKLSREIGAIILPRLTLANSGIMVSPTYIDPSWDGILQLHIQNQSPNRFELAIGEKIAICRFYPLSGPASISDAKSFPRKSHHYGLNWDQILASDRDPFPFRKSKSQKGGLRGSLASLGRWLLQNWRKLITAASLAAALGAIGWLYSAIMGLSQLENQSRTITELQNRTDTQASQIARLEETKPLTGIATVTIPANRQSGSTTLDIPITNPNATALAFLEGVAPKDATVTATLVQTRSVSTWQLKLTVSQSQTGPSDHDYEVTYVVIPA